MSDRFREMNTNNQRGRDGNTAGYEDLFCPNLSDFPLPTRPHGRQYRRVLLPTLGSVEYPRPAYSRNPFEVRCVAGTPSLDPSEKGRSSLFFFITLMPRIE